MKRASIFAFVAVCFEALARPANADTVRTDGSLLVSDATVRSVLRFPLVNDVPIGTPVGSLRTTYVPGAIAVSVDGALFVSDAAHHAVDAYAPGARGNAAPIRTLNLKHAAHSLAIDAQGFLYVGGAFGSVSVFAPGAAGSARPVEQIPLFDSYTAVSALAIDEGGRLYASQGVGSGAFVVLEYGNPKTKPTYLRAILATGPTAPLGGVNGLATDPSGELYISQTLWPQVWAFSESACCTYPTDRVITPGDTYAIFPAGVALRGRRLYFLSGSNGPNGTHVPVIYVFDPLLGFQPPIDTISGPFMKNPVGVAVTP